MAAERTLTERLLQEVTDGLLACLVGQLEAQGDPPCWSGFYVGSEAVAEHCGCRQPSGGCGMAWVRIESIYPARAFPTADSQASASCDSPLAVALELGVYRCLPTTNAQGKPPPAIDLANAMLTQTADIGAMHKAMSCCEAMTRRPHLVGRYAPRERGGCGGGVWPVTVQLVQV